MSQQHTPEPWHTGGNGTIVYDAAGWGVANAQVFHGRQDGPEEAKANARRIVAAVNACAIASTENLEKYGAEAIVSGNTLVLEDKLKNAEKQRDELLAALELAVREFEDMPRCFGISATHNMPVFKDAISRINEVLK